jgi:hypothetical protein
MEILFYLVCFGIGLLLGTLIYHSTKPKCNHKWKLYQNGNIRSNGKHTGFYKVYECEHCLKMRKEQVEID